MNYSFFHLKRILYNIHVISSSSMFHIMKFVPVIFSQLHTFLAYLLQTDQARYRLILIRSKQYKIRFYNVYLKLQKYKSSHHCFKLGLQKQYRIWFNYDGERDREKKMYLIFEAYACLWTSW